MVFLLPVLLPWNEFLRPKYIIVANSQQAYIFIFEVLCCFKGSVKLFLMAAQVLEHKMAVSIKMCQLIELLWSDQMWFCLKPEKDWKLSNWTCHSSVHLNAFSLPALCFDYCLSFTTFDIPYPGRSWDSVIVQQ